MANSSLLLSQILRRSPHFSAANPFRLITNPSAATLSSPYLVPSRRSSASLFLSSRFFSACSNDGDNELNFTEANFADDLHVGCNNLVAEQVVTSASQGNASPVGAVISLLDYSHDLTGLPWWIIIASSTVAMRAALVPLLVLQLNKLQKISECLLKLPPPFPPPLSGRSYLHQFSLFYEKKRALGCPSFIWFFSFFSVQVPCFFLWMTSIRRMSLDHHPGFDSGGMLWFQNLTELPHGVLGTTFPVLIAGLHYINVQLSFKSSSLQNMTGLLGLLAKYYKHYLDFCTLPLFFVGYCIPQGSLIYWVTNSSLSAIQQFCLQHPAVRGKLGLTNIDSPKAATNSDDKDTPKSASLDLLTMPSLLSTKDSSPKELVTLSVKYLSDGLSDRAIPLLRLALEKDPDCIMAMIVMGQTLLQNGWHAEAAVVLEHAISKLLHDGHRAEGDKVNDLVVASQWAGVACLRQGKNEEGILHLERVAGLEEPENPKSKADYFDSLVLLASALCNEGRKAEAVKHLRVAVAYNPDYQELLHQWESEVDDLVSDLVSSRRRDY